MSQTTTSMIRILLIQCFLAALLAIPFQNAAAFEVKEDSIVSARVNSYVFEGDALDLKEQLMLLEDEKVKVINIRAQGIEQDAKITLKVNGTEEIVMPLEDRMKTVSFTVNKRINTLEVSSPAAFVRAARARVQTDGDQPHPEGDQPHPEDIGRGFFSVTTIQQGQN